jgi:uncharacterized membrane protein (UPF0127 family)
VVTFLTPALKSPSRSYSLVNDRTGIPIVAELEIAVESATRRKGLLGRDSLAETTGIVIAPTNAVHTFFMRFPIDIVFVTRAGRVLKVRHSVPARRMAIALRAFAVVELAAGCAARQGLRPGDFVSVRPA